MARRRSLRICVAAALCLVTLAPARAAAPPGELGVPLGKASPEGLALAGPQVAFALREGEVPAVYVAGAAGRTRFWRAHAVPLPKDFHVQPMFSASVEQGVGALAGSRTLLAFVHEVAVHERARCRPLCGVPDLTTPVSGEVWAGPPDGRPRLVAGVSGPCGSHAIVHAVAVSGDVIAYADRIPACRGDIPPLSRVVLLRASGERTVLARSRELRFLDVRLAWPFVAWYEEGSRPASTIVTDLRSRRVVLRLRVAPPLDVDRYGTVASVAPAPDVSSCARLALASPAAKQLRFVEPAVASAVRIVRGRVAYVRPRACESSWWQLVVRTIGGAARVVPRAEPLSVLAAFDFDGTRIAYAETRRSGETTIHVRRVP